MHKLQRVWMLLTGGGQFPLMKLQGFLQKFFESHPDLIRQSYQTASGLQLTLSDLRLTLPDLQMTLPDLYLTLPDLKKALPDLHLAIPDIHLALPDLQLTFPDLHMTCPQSSSDRLHDTHLT